MNPRKDIFEKVLVQSNNFDQNRLLSRPLAPGHISPLLLRMPKFVPIHFVIASFYHITTP